MRLEVVALLLVLAQFHCTLSLEETRRDEEAPVLQDQLEDVINEKAQQPPATEGDEQSPEENQPPATEGDEESPEENQPPTTEGDEESPKDDQPPSTEGDEKIAEGNQPPATEGDEESTKDGQPPTTEGDEKSPKDDQPLATEGDKKKPDEEQPPATEGDEDIFESPNHYPEAEEMKQVNVEQEFAAEAEHGPEEIPNDGSEGKDDMNDPLAPLALECRRYRYLLEYDRSVSYRGVVKCDRLATGWYRLLGRAGVKMPDRCVPKYQCGTHAPGWLVGGHPTVAQGSVLRKVCFHWTSGCCQWSRYIRVRNCGAFYVYYLGRTPVCNLRYCGEAIRPLECRSYRTLSEYDRAQGYRGVVKCDRSLPTTWYRFTGSAGNMMPSRCVAKYYCGTHAPGWLVGGHPTVAQGMVSRRVCFHWSSSCCQWSRYIRVRNCGPFYVYWLSPTPYCNLRYCGNRGGGGGGSECRSYRTLSGYDRAQGYSLTVARCDRPFIKTWYRFTGRAGYKMADSCVPQRRCNTHAPGWLFGGHPSVGQGIVSRRVCFHWSNKCCQWSIIIRVRNCGAFYVYELPPTPGCRLRYCGNRR